MRVANYVAEFNFLVPPAFSAGTTISPWIVTLDALEPFASDTPEQVLSFAHDSISRHAN